MVVESSVAHVPPNRTDAPTCAPWPSRLRAFIPGPALRAVLVSHADDDNRQRAASRLPRFQDDGLTLEVGLHLQCEQTGSSSRRRSVASVACERLPDASGQMALTASESDCGVRSRGSRGLRFLKGGSEDCASAACGAQPRWRRSGRHELFPPSRDGYQLAHVVGVRDNEGARRQFIGSDLVQRAGWKLPWRHGLVGHEV